MRKLSIETMLANNMPDHTYIPASSSSSSSSASSLSVLPPTPTPDPVALAALLPTEPFEIQPEAAGSLQSQHNANTNPARLATAVVPSVVLLNKSPLAPNLVRKKREWTVLQEHDEEDGPNGRMVYVTWAETVVYGSGVKYDNDKPYILADGRRYYIADSSTGEVDPTGKAIRRCWWKHEFIPKALLEPGNGFTSRYRMGTNDSGPDLEVVPPTRRAAPVGPTTGSEESPRGGKERPSRSRSAVLSGRVEKHYPTNFQFSVRSSEIDYGPAIHRLIEQNLGVEIVTPAKRVVPPIVKRWMQGKIVRPVHFREWCESRLAKPFVTSLTLLLIIARFSH